MARTVHSDFDLPKAAIHLLDRGRVGNSVLIADFARYLLRDGFYFSRTPGVKSEPA